VLQRLRNLDITEVYINSTSVSFKLFINHVSEIRENINIFQKE
jgi:hypothetical protein